MIFVKKDERELAAKIDKAIFPELQGGPHENAIAAIAAALNEAIEPKFKVYAAQVVKNTKALASELEGLGWRIVSGGTDNHLMLVDFDTRKPIDIPSGIRLGTAAEATRGMKERDMHTLAQKINLVLRITLPPKKTQ